MKRKIKPLIKTVSICAVCVLAGFLIGFNTRRPVIVKYTQLPKPAPITETAAATDEVITDEVTAEEFEYLDIPLSHELQDYTREVCATYDVPFELAIALIEVESSFRPDVISKTHDYGYMQINKGNHKALSKALGIKDFLDPKQNILAGVYMFSNHLKAANGDVATALMMYNRGTAGAKKLLAKGICTTSYTDRVIVASKAYVKD